MLLFRAGRVPASPTNANGNGVTTNIYEEVGNILIGLRIIRLRQTKLDIGLSLPEPEPPELRTPHINIWDMIYNKREGGRGERLTPAARLVSACRITGVDRPLELLAYNRI